MSHFLVSYTAERMALFVCRSTFLVIAFIAIAHAARRINVQDQMMRSRRSLSSVEVSSRDLFGLTRGENLEEIKELPTSHGTKKVKFVETYDGIPVVGASAVLEKDGNSHFVGGSSGHLISDIDEDIQGSTPQLSSDDALKVAMRQNRHDAKDVRFDKSIDSRLEIIMEDGEEEDKPVARLVYRISYMVQTDDDLERPFTLVDAITGDVVRQWDGLSMNNARDKNSDRVQGEFEISGVGGNAKIGKAKYGEDFPKLKVDIGCKLENNVAKVFSCKGSRCSPAPYAFNCKAGFNDSVNGAYSPMRDALFYISATYEMFDKWYGIENPLQRKGSTETICKARVHYGYRYENAFWDGRYITFGDGYNRFYPLTSINVVAHEISHGVTEMNSGLIYSGQSGGMNEAFSDMAGEAVEYYATKKQDWMVGYEIFKDPEGALRYFIDPSKDGKSLSHMDDYCGGINVHYSSGLFNRAFYYLGDTEGWDVKKAFHPFVVANELYWTENSKFYEGACGVVQAAKDLDLNADDVTTAFRKVGIEPCVETMRGLMATANLKGPVGHKVRAQVIVTKEMAPFIDNMSVKVKVHVPMDIQLKSPVCNHCAEKLHGYSSKTFEVCNVKEGVYEVGLTPTETDMWNSAVGFYGPTTMVAENITLLGYYKTHHVKFEMPKIIGQFDLQAIMMMRARYGYVVAFLRYNEIPDLLNAKYDYKFYKNSEKLICKPKPGTWHVIFKSYDRRVRGVSLELSSILNGKRVDVIPTIPAPTTPAPTEEESGEGSGEGSGNTM